MAQRKRICDEDDSSIDNTCRDRYRKIKIRCQQKKKLNVLFLLHVLFRFLGNDDKM